MRARWQLLTVVAAHVAVLSATPAHAAKPAWDRATNIADAARRLVDMHRAQGSKGVVKFLDACYRTHTNASQFTAPLEACMAQDYIHSRVLAVIYARMPAGAVDKLGIPSPELIARAVDTRFSTVFSQYAISKTAADALVAGIERHGLPLFLESAFPARDGEPARTERKSDRKGEAR